MFPDLAGGGAERAVLNVTRHLDWRQFQSTIFIFRNVVDYAQEIPDGVSVCSGGRADSRLRSDGHRMLARLLQCAVESDVVVGGYELEPTYFAYVAARLCRKPVIGWVHISMEMRLRRAASWHRRMVRFLYPRLDKIVAVSQGATDSLLSVVCLPQDRVKLIHPMLDPMVFSMNSSDGNPGLLPPYDGPTVVAVGRLEHQKGFDVLIKAHSRLRIGGSRHRLVILGEGPLRAELQRLAEDLHVSDSVVMPGFVKDPFSVLRRADVFALSSRFEGFPIVLVEALALNLPAVAMDCPSGPDEILDKGKYGLLVRPEDESGLAEAIGRVLSDKDLREKLRSDARSRALEFAPERIIPQWENLLDGVCA